MISSVTTLTAQKAHEKGLEFLAHVSPEIPEHLLGDPLRLGQILTNLVNNAVKFTETGEIRLSIDLAGAHGREGQARVLRAGHGHRHDPGAGGEALPAVHAGRHVDDPQARRDRARPDDLPAARRADGRADPAGERGRVRAAPSPSRSGSASARPRGPGGPSRVGSTTCGSWSWTTTPPRGRSSWSRSGRWPSHVDAVSSGPEAIAAIRERDADTPYDIVFMDWRMPGMDGLQATRHHQDRRARSSKQPAVVIVTAFGREEVREEAENLHVDGFLLKPVTKSMLVDSMVNIFASAAGEESGAAPERADESSRLRGLRDPPGRGQRDQPADRGRAARRGRRRGDRRQQRAGGGGEALRRPVPAAVRPGSDGPSDAGDGRLPGDAKDPLGRAVRHALRSSR